MPGTGSQISAKPFRESLRIWEERFCGFRQKRSRCSAERFVGIKTKRSVVKLRLKSPGFPRKKPVCASCGLCAGSRPCPRTERQRAFVAGAFVRDKRRSGSDNVVTTALCSFDNRVRPTLYLDKVDFRQHCQRSKTEKIKAVNFSATLPKGARENRGQ